MAAWYVASPTECLAGQGTAGPFNPTDHGESRAFPSSNRLRRASAASTNSAARSSIAARSLTGAAMGVYAMWQYSLMTALVGRAQLEVPH